MARRTGKSNPARALAVEAARAALDNKAEDIIVLDLRDLSPVTDYFVICTGTSDRQMRSTADEIIKRGKAIGQPIWQSAGMDTGGWIVLDFVDVVVHIFDQQHRKYYDLELIWGEASRIRWRPSAPRKPKKE